MMTPPEMVLKELRAAHAVISRAEWVVKQYMNASEPSNSAKKAENTPSGASEEVGKATDTPNCPEAVDCEICADFALPKGKKAIQEEFDLSESTTGKIGEKENKLKNASEKANKTDEKSEIDGSATVVKKDIKRKRGTPVIDRRTALANFRTIAGSKEILDLGDVNRIFGYAPNTSGIFIKYAVQRGDLGTITYGAQKKFLARDVKEFIKSWYDSVEG